jgi:transposase
VARRSVTSIRAEHPPKGGNKQLKRAFFRATFAALADPLTRAYYDRRRAEGKKHNAARNCLAGRRVDVPHALLRNQPVTRLNR